MVFDEKFSNPRKGVEPLKRDSFVCCEETSHRRKWTFSNDVSGVGSMKSAKSS